MKVLVVSHAYVERDNQRKLELLSAHENFEVGVVYPKNWMTWHGEEKKFQISNPRSKISYQEFALDTFFSGDAGKYFYNPLQLIISIINFRPDLIYFEEEPFSFAGFQLSVISWLLTIKFSFFTWENIVDLKLGLVRSVIEKFVFETAASAMAGTAGARERLSKRGFKKGIEVVPQFGVDIGVFRPSTRSHLVDVVTVGFVGRPSIAKGIDILMYAVSEVPFECRLLIVTSSKEIPQEFFDLAKSLKISEKVRFETLVPHADLPKYFNQMDVFVLPSRTTKTWKEQFGRALIEAMASGVPVIGSSSGAIPEVIGDAGLVFNEDDSSDLANKLNSLLEVNIRSDFSLKGEEGARNLYSSEVLTEKLYNFLVKFSPAQNK